MCALGVETRGNVDVKVEQAQEVRLERVQLGDSVQRADE